VRRLLWIAGLSRPMRAVLVSGLKRAGQHWMARIVNHARPRSTDAYWQLIERKNQLVARVLANMCQHGVSAILCPPHALPAMPHVKAFDLLAAASYSMVVNLLGLPSGTLATTRVSPNEDGGRSVSRDRVSRRAAQTDAGSAGLPIGIQISALPWREDIVLALMETLEKWAAVTSDYPGSYIVPAG
jgi:fatty acid amide hydrolase